MMVACDRQAAGCCPRCADRAARASHRAAGGAGHGAGGGERGDVRAGGAAGAGGVPELGELLDAAVGRRPARPHPAGTPAGQGKKARRRPGKQPGAPGSHLAWSEQADDTVPHFPQGICGCGRDLAGAADLGVAASHQEIDIPLVTARVIQHDLHEVACACGRVHRAASPSGAAAPGTVTYSVQLRAWCVFLIAAHHMPVHRAAQLIESLTGARPSPGFVHALIARAAAAVAQANTLIRAMIILARVVCADETPIRCGPGPKTRKRYLLVACTHLLTYYLVGDRSLASFEAFVFPDLTGVIVHDRYQNYVRHEAHCYIAC